MDDMDAAMFKMATSMEAVAAYGSELTNEEGVIMKDVVHVIMTTKCIPAVQGAMDQATLFLDNFLIFDAATCRGMLAPIRANLAQIRVALQGASDVTKVDEAAWREKLEQNESAANNLQDESDGARDRADELARVAHHHRVGGLSVCWIPLVGQIIAACTEASANSLLRRAQHEREESDTKLSQRRQIIDKVIPCIKEFLGALGALQDAIYLVDRDLVKFQHNARDADTMPEFEIYHARMMAYARKANTSCCKFASATKQFKAIAQ
jgi:hypothetical protein